MANTKTTLDQPGATEVCPVVPCLSTPMATGPEPERAELTEDEDTVLPESARLQRRFAPRYQLFQPGEEVDPEATLARVNTGLRAIQPEYPKMYAVADLRTEQRRRWFSCERLLESGKLAEMVHIAESSAPCRERAEERALWARTEVAHMVAHAFVGRVATAFTTQVRAWDPGWESVAVRTDVDGGLDWAGVADPLVRVLSTDELAERKDTVGLPSEEAMATWIVGRTMPILAELFRFLAGRRSDMLARIGSTVPDALVGAGFVAPQTLQRSDIPEGREGAERRSHLLLRSYLEAGLRGTPGRGRDRRQRRAAVHRNLADGHSSRHC